MNQEINSPKIQLHFLPIRKHTHFIQISNQTTIELTFSF